MIDGHDAAILERIALALDAVGHELDAADRVPGRDPWGAIAAKEAQVHSLAVGLSDGFRLAHANLAQRLLGCTNLHLCWGSLCDEIDRRLGWDGGAPDDNLPGGVPRDME
ncbi:MAG: hypothetical protein JXA09_10710 [Anaerolineae bacterium]|nr:hypothetical protein [Anaerolineae bacterium]